MSQAVAADIKPPQVTFAEHCGLRLLILPSELCFVVPLEGLSKDLSGQPLFYEIEPHVLVSAESMVVDVHRSDLGTLALIADGSDISVASDESELKATIGLTIKVGLIVQGYLGQQSDRKQQEAICFVICNGPSIDVVVVKQNKVTAWKYCAAEEAIQEATSFLEGDAHESNARVVVLDGGEELLQQMAVSGLSSRVEISRLNSNDLADAAAQRVLQGREKLLVSLKGPTLSAIDPLRPIQTPVYAALAGLALLVVCLVGGLLYRTSVYHRETEAIVAQQEALFQQVFPKQKLPVGLMSRFRSEHRRLRLTKGADARPEVPNVLAIFHALLESLPSDNEARYQIQNVRLEQDSLSLLSGSVATLEDLDRFRQSLEQGGFQLPPVNSRIGPQGVPVQWSSVSWKAPKVTQGQAKISSTDSDSSSTAATITAKETR